MGAASRSTVAVEDRPRCEIRCASGDEEQT